MYTITSNYLPSMDNIYLRMVKQWELTLTSINFFNQKKKKKLTQNFELLLFVLQNMKNQKRIYYHSVKSWNNETVEPCSLVHLLIDHINISLILSFHTHKTLLKGLDKTLLWQLPVEPLSIFTVVVDHVVVSDPLHLPHLTVTQLAVCGRAPPISCGSEGALHNANWSIPFACSCPESAKSSSKWCAAPVYLYQSPSSRPIIRVPYARINSHSLLIGIRNPHALIVGEDSDWKPINKPPGIDTSYSYVSCTFVYVSRTHLVDGRLMGWC